MCSTHSASPYLLVENSLDPEKYFFISNTVLKKLPVEKLIPRYLQAIRKEI